MDMPAARPMDLLALCETMKANADEVARAMVDHWRTIGEAEPWHRLPDDLGHDHLPHLIRDLAGAALCTEFDREMCRRAVRTSAAHGERRAEAGLDDALLYREYHLLRRALWRQMKRVHGETATIYYAAMRLDALVSLANAAALHGLNRGTLEAEGRWPRVLDALLDDWPLPSA
ncbi:MAG: hypothetical protein ACLFRX_10165 [Gemmatimonadota bacterium]